jgi:sporulation protein YlmC with PRC-barrel domain
MNETTRYTIGAEVSCGDEACGQLERVVIDPVAQRVTHLVVAPGHSEGAKRLVPVDLAEVSGAGGSDIRLSCTTDAFGALEPAEETEFLPGSGGSGDSGGLGYQPEQMIAWPYYGLGVGAVGFGDPGVLGPPGAAPQVYDRIPAGEVQVRRGEPVQATDGGIGHVKGLVIDPQDHGVTHVLLQEGHLWGRKTVAIPIRTVSYAGGEVKVALTKKELGDLPPVAFDERG